MCIIYTYIQDVDLLSLSTMVTVDWLGLPIMITSGAELDSIMRPNVSLFSNMLSSVMETSNEALVIPTGNLTSYGPGV